MAFNKLDYAARRIYAGAFRPLNPADQARMDKAAAKRARKAQKGK